MTSLFLNFLSGGIVFLGLFSLAWIMKKVEKAR